MCLMQMRKEVDALAKLQPIRNTKKGSTKSRGRARGEKRSWPSRTKRGKTSRVAKEKPLIAKEEAVVEPAKMTRVKERLTGGTINAAKAVNTRMMNAPMNAPAAKAAVESPTPAMPPAPSTGRSDTYHEEDKSEDQPLIHDRALFALLWLFTPQS
jgi:hypothetical protein